MGPLPWEDSARAPIYVRVDSTHVARSLNADPGIMFGRLYYYLDYKHRYQQPNGGWVHLFAFEVGEKRHCVNFPYLCAVLAEKRLEHWKTMWPLIFSGLSLFVAATSLVVACLALGAK